MKIIDYTKRFCLRRQISLCHSHYFLPLLTSQSWIELQSFLWMRSETLHVWSICFCRRGNHDNQYGASMASLKTTGWMGNVNVCVLSSMWCLGSNLCFCCSIKLTCAIYCPFLAHSLILAYLPGFIEGCTGCWFFFCNSIWNIRNSKKWNQWWCGLNTLGAFDKDQQNNNVYNDIDIHTFCL